MAIKKLPSTGDRPQHSPGVHGLPVGQHAGGKTDSAGLPWEGRTFAHHDTAFAADNGESPAEFTAAVERLREADATLREAYNLADPQQLSVALAGLHEAETALLETFAKIRVLVPLVAAGGDFGVTDTGKVVEKTQELSIVTVTAPDGRAVMPIFTSTAAMRAWNPTSRPIPVPAGQAIIAATQEATPLLVVDPADEATRVGIRQSRFEQLATGNMQPAIWHDSDCAATFRNRLTAADTRVKTVLFLPGDQRMDLTGPELQIVIGVEPGLAQTEIQDISGKAGAVWSQLPPEIQERADGVQLKFAPATLAG